MRPGMIEILRKFTLQWFVQSRTNKKYKYELLKKKIKNTVYLLKLWWEKLDEIINKLKKIIDNLKCLGKLFEK